MRGLLCLSLVVLGALVASAGSALAAPVELITNGGFEQGFTGWTDTTTLVTPYCAWAVAGSGCLGSAPAADGGSKFASNGFDGSGPGTYTLTQTVTIPAGTATLSWEDDFRTRYRGTPRTADVRILDASGTTTLGTVYTYVAPFNVFFTGWTPHSVDVSAFAGQTVQIAFVQTIPQNFTGPAGFGIDNVELLADPAPVASGSRVAYCAVAGDTWPDGSAMAPGTFLDLVDGQPSTDPHYRGATYASYVEGRGLTCDAPPAGYKRQAVGDPYADYAP